MMTTVLAPMDQTVTPYVFRGGGGNKEDQATRKSHPMSTTKISPAHSGANNSMGNSEGLEMIYEEDVESASNSPCGVRQNLLMRGINDINPFESALSPSPSLKRSRSLPQDEFRIIGQKLHELQRNDSMASGKSGR